MRPLKLLLPPLLVLGILTTTMTPAAAGDSDAPSGRRGGDNQTTAGSRLADGDDGPGAVVEAGHRAGIGSSPSRVRRAGGNVSCRYYEDGSGDPFDFNVPPGDYGQGIQLVRDCIDSTTGEYVSIDVIAWQPGEPSVEPAELAEMQVRRISLPTPGVGTSPSETHDQLIRVPTWLWVSSGWQPVSATASAGPVTATVTATPSHVLWDMGDGKQVTCNGPGVAYDTNRLNAEQQTDCSHTYQRTSIGQPGERFPVEASVVWSVSWTSNVGEGGSLGMISETRDFSLRVVQAQALNRPAEPQKGG